MATVITAVYFQPDMAMQIHSAASGRLKPLVLDELRDPSGQLLQSLLTIKVSSVLHQTLSSQKTTTAGTHCYGC